MGVSATCNCMDNCVGEPLKCGWGLYTASVFHEEYQLVSSLPTKLSLFIIHSTVCEIKVNPGRQSNFLVATNMGEQIIHEYNTCTYYAHALLTSHSIPCLYGAGNRSFHLVDQPVMSNSLLHCKGCNESLHAHVYLYLPLHIQTCKKRTCNINNNTQKAPVEFLHHLLHATFWILHYCQTFLYAANLT